MKKRKTVTTDKNYDPQDWIINKETIHSKFTRIPSFLHFKQVAGLCINTNTHAYIRPVLPRH